MKLRIRSNFSFSKLASKMPGLVEKYSAKVGKGAVQGIKNAIEKGKYEKLSDTTIDIRKRGISPNAGGIATGSTKPLIHTGELLRSIKPKKGGVELLKYGVYQNAGYTTVNNAFTGAYYKETGKQLANKKVPARPFIDKGFAEETTEGKRASEDLFKDMERAIRK